MIPLKIFGHHNMLNLEGARLVCEAMGVRREVFYEAISSFGGASKRLQQIGEGKDCAVFNDFAHSPSKLKATIDAVKDQFPERKLIAVMELHTYSSLSSGFLSEYASSMDKADEAIVYYSPHALKLKRLPELSTNAVGEAFQKGDIHVFNNGLKLKEYLYSLKADNSNLLMMSSGNFDGIDLKDLAQHFLGDWQKLKMQ